MTTTMAFSVLLLLQSAMTHTSRRCAVWRATMDAMSYVILSTLNRACARRYSVRPLPVMRANALYPPSCQRCRCALTRMRSQFIVSCSDGSRLMIGSWDSMVALVHDAARNATVHKFEVGHSWVDNVKSAICATLCYIVSAKRDKYAFYY